MDEPYDSRKPSDSPGPVPDQFRDDIYLFLGAENAGRGFEIPDIAGAIRG